MLFPNILIIDRDRFQNTGGRADIFNSKDNSIFLDMVIVLDAETFDVISNRHGPCSLAVPLEFLDKYVRHMKEPVERIVPTGPNWDEAPF